MIDDPRRDRDVLSEGAVTPVIATRNTQHLAAIAKVHLSLATKPAAPAVDRRIKGHAFTGLQPLYLISQSFNSPCGFMAHDERRDAPAGAAVISVNVAPADAACPDPYQNVARPDLGLRHLDHLEFQVIL